MSSSAIPQPHSPKALIFLEFISAFKTWDTSKLELHLTDDLEMHFLPASFGHPVARGKEAFLEIYSSVHRFFDEVTIEILEFIETHEKIVVQAKAVNTVSKTGAVYDNDWIFIFHFNSDNKIVTYKEFLDSKFIMDFIPAEIERRKERNLEE